MNRWSETFAARFWPLLPGLLGLALFLLAAAHGQQILREVVEATEARKHARTSLMQANAVLSLLKDVETSQRGFLLSGDPAYLLPYDEALARLPGLLEELRAGASLDVGGDALGEIPRHIRLRLDIAADLVARRRETNFADAYWRTRLDQGKAAMDRVRADFTRLEARLAARLQALDDQVGDAQRRATRTGTVLILLAGSLLALAYLLLLREQRSRVRAEQALTAAAAQRAEQRGAELSSVFEALPDLFFRLAPDGVILDYRARHDDLYVAPEHFLGRRMQDVLAPETGRLFRDKLEELQWRRELVVFEYPLDMPDGRHHYEARLNRLPGTKEFILVVRDVSARVKADGELRQARDDLRSFAGRLDRDIEDERRRLAREVHDQIGQIFTALKLQVRACKTDAPLGTDKSAELDALLDEGIRVARRISADLRPPLLDDLGLGPALEHEARKLAQRAGLESQTRIDADPRLTPEQSNQLFRIAQEALANIARHAEARRLRIRGEAGAAEYCLAIEDDGCGWGPAPEAGLGLLGLRERAALAGAETRLETSEMGGARVWVRLPLEQGRE